jgi:hypothetical protein
MKNRSMMDGVAILAACIIEVDLFDCVNFQLSFRFSGKFYDSPQLNGVSEEKRDQRNDALGVMNDLWVHQIDQNHAQDYREDGNINDVHAIFHEIPDPFGCASNLSALMMGYKSTPRRRQAMNSRREAVVS